MLIKREFEEKFLQHFHNAFFSLLLVHNQFYFCLYNIYYLLKFLHNKIWIFAFTAITINYVVKKKKKLLFWFFFHKNSGRVKFCTLFWRSEHRIVFDLKFPCFRICFYLPFSTVVTYFCKYKPFLLFRTPEKFKGYFRSTKNTSFFSEIHCLFLFIVLALCKTWD